MVRIVTIISLVLLVVYTSSAQFTEVARHNAYLTKSTWTGPDSTKPYASDQGVRTVWVGSDLDKDGKPEIIATDYSNKGRVHVFEFTTPDKLELVWSSPLNTNGGGSTPRWVRTGDLDGDGKGEIVFPNSSSAGADIQILVYQWTGVDNDYGTAPALVLPMNNFSSLGVGNFRMNREVADENDYDGDGRSELITVDRDNKVYILGVTGDIASGFASWQLEGGDPSVVTENRFSGGSQWHAVSADIDGDGKKEIVNHYWNFFGFWSIDPLGPDSYRYPRPVADSATNPAAAQKWHYHEYTRPWNADAVSYMGVQPVDVDGDGKDEIAGIIYTGASSIEYNAALVSIAKGDTGVYVWKDSTQFGLIGQDLLPAGGGELWGIGAYDFNGNGRQELLLGGYGGYDVISLEYNGTGSILDKANYTKTVPYSGDGLSYAWFTYIDSAGVKDTLRQETPFVSKMFAGSDVNANGEKDVVLAYQSIYDSLTLKWQHYDLTGPAPLLVTDSTKKVLNTYAVNIKLLDWTGANFVESPYTLVTPEDYRLEQNYPNPFNPSTEIRFSLPVDKKISLTIYDLLGREVKTLINNEPYTEGSHRVTWDGTNASNAPVSSGTYIATMKYGNFARSIKMMLVK